MSISFDLDNVDVAEFGVGRNVGAERRYAMLPIHLDVQRTIQGMVAATSQKMEASAEPPSVFDPAEKYASEEYLTLPINHELAGRLRTLHETANLEYASDHLDWITNCFCYFAQLRDGLGNHLTALRRATQFKGALNKQNRVLSLGSDVLQIVDRPILQLNADFDVIVDSDSVHIIHPNSFKLLGQIEEAIAEAVPRNVAAIAEAATFVEWANVEQYAASHSRAASLLASIRTNGYADNLDVFELESLCAGTDVLIENVQGKIVVPDKQVLQFLEVVDRRRYEIGLVPHMRERYRASSRTRVGGSGA